jgi:hypothetical protein
MKICRILLHLVMVASAFSQSRPVDSSPHPRVGKLTLDPQSVTVLRLHAGFVSSVRLPEEVSSVVLGDPKCFKAEHSEAEPRLVFLKPLSSKPGETNVLITTKSGHEVALHLVSDGVSNGGDVDFFIDYERPHSFLIHAGQPSFLIGESRPLNSEASPPSSSPNQATGEAHKELLRQSRIGTPEWVGKQLQVAIGAVTQSGPQMIVAFSVLNNTHSTLELLPPQVQLAGPSKQGPGKTTKAEQIPIADYTLTQRRLGPGTRADGVVMFERPGFKESSEHLLLQIAQVDQVDHPVLVPILFTAPANTEAQ